MSLVCLEHARSFSDVDTYVIGPDSLGLTFRPALVLSTLSSEYLRSVLGSDLSAGPRWRFFVSKVDLRTTEMLIIHNRLYPPLEKLSTLEDLSVPVYVQCSFYLA